jgi:hypothetical protein
MIDWNRVRSLREEVGADDFEDVLDAFFEESEEVVGRLRNSSMEDQLEFDLHFLKNCALNLGFGELSTLCQAGEKQVSAGNGATVNLTAILESFDMSRQRFLAELNREIDAM